MATVLRLDIGGAKATVMIQRRDESASHQKVILEAVGSTWFYLEGGANRTSRLDWRNLLTHVCVN